MRRVAIEPGEFRTHAVLEQAVRSPDGQGGFTVAWADRGRLFVKIEPVGAARRFEADQSQGAITHRVWLRANGDVRSGVRLRVGARELLIVTVRDPDEAGRYLVCEAREVGP